MVRGMKILPVLLLVSLDTSFLEMGSTVLGQSQAATQVLESLADTPSKPAQASMDLSIQKAKNLLAGLQSDLAVQAIGSVLSKQLHLQELAQELGQANPNPDKLRKIEDSLRRILPGAIQKKVDELRMQIQLLARQLYCSAEDQSDLHKAIAVLKNYRRDGHSTTSSVNEYNIRNAFHTLADKHIDISHVALIRDHLSLPNYLSRVRSDFLIRESKSSFSIPIDFKTCADNTSIFGTGQFQVDLSLEIPSSYSESFLRICANGKGVINVSARRSKAQVCATIEPRISGSQGVHLRTKEIAADQPSLKASLKTDLIGVSLDGILGRSRLIQNVAKRVIQEKLTENDPILASQIEERVASRVEEEAYQLAYRVNGLIRHGVWDRLGSLDFVPEVHIQNDEEFIHNKTVFARFDQLGALTPPPTIPPGIDHGLDITTWVHESAANNILQSLAGQKIDEATLRGLLQVECKLTSDEWESLQPAKVPTVLFLAAESPIQLQFQQDLIELDLDVTGVEWDGHQREVKPCRLKIGYRLESDEKGFKLTRQKLGFADSVSVEDQTIWMKALDGFLPKAIRPLPRFNNRQFSPFIRVGYLKIDTGWLVVGASRLSPAKDAVSK